MLQFYVKALREKLKVKGVKILSYHINQAARDFFLYNHYLHNRVHLNNDRDLNEDKTFTNRLIPNEVYGKLSLSRTMCLVSSLFTDKETIKNMIYDVNEAYESDVKVSSDLSNHGGVVIEKKSISKDESFNIKSLLVKHNVPVIADFSIQDTEIISTDSSLIVVPDNGIVKFTIQSIIAISMIKLLKLPIRLDVARFQSLYYENNNVNNINNATDTTYYKDSNHYLTSYKHH